ncbi:MAG: heme-binding protein [Candidatus Melainabacteria bacterium]|nr:heme-binding protein [Candidatus Melainabacteria bacterium]
MKNWLLIALILTIIGGGASMLANAKKPKYETPVYTVKNSTASFEVRQYKPLVIAEVTTVGERKEAINEGFMILAGYIFGKNDKEVKLPMTTPVGQYGLSEDKDNDQWVTEFIMPKGYTKETLPKPTNTNIRFIDLPASTWAVFQFSGNPTTAELKKRSDDLKAALKATGMPTVMAGIPVCYAFYNPPFTPWFLRRNEVMIRVNP